MNAAHEIEIDVKVSDKKTLAFTVDPAGKRSACFALGVRKSGSSVFANITKALADHNRMRTVDIPAVMFEEGYRYSEWNSTPSLKNLLWKGNMYLGFRDAPTVFYNDPIFRAGKKILLVRDPRDALVSEYFSNAFTHSLPGNSQDDSVVSVERKVARQTSVEEYSLQRVEHLNRTVMAYRPLLGDRQLLIMRYEDVILQKASWIRRIAAHFELDAPEELIMAIVGWADNLPDKENPQAFVRRVVPGDHRDKLSKAGIAAIEDRLSAIWKELGYDFGKRLRAS